MAEAIKVARDIFELEPKNWGNEWKRLAPRPRAQDPRPWREAAPFDGLSLPLLGQSTSGKIANIGFLLLPEARAKHHYWDSDDVPGSMVVMITSDCVSDWGA